MKNMKIIVYNLRISSILVLSKGSCDSLYLGTSGNGVFSYVNVITAVEDIINYKTPEDFKLNQNFPNPFNSETTISYSLFKTSRVLLKIYDIMGNEVSILTDRVQHSGYYKTNFDASNFASGIYLARLIINATDGESFIKSIKMVMVMVK